MPKDDEILLLRLAHKGRLINEWVITYTEAMDDAEDMAKILDAVADDAAKFYGQEVNPDA